MKTLAIICYVIGSVLLIASCFTTGVTITWVLGGISVVMLTLGCIFQFNNTRNNQAAKYRHHYRHG